MKALDERHRPLTRPAASRLVASRWVSDRLEDVGRGRKGA